jgi:hypothetical protein
MEVMVMRDLIKQLDPQHMYTFSAEYGAFLKTKLPQPMEKEQLDRHLDESSLEIIDLTYNPSNFIKQAEGGKE